MPIVIPVLIVLGIAAAVLYERSKTVSAHPAAPAAPPGTHALSALPPPPPPLGGPGSPAATLALRASDSTKTVKLKVGQTLNIVLPFVPAHGVYWQGPNVQTDALSYYGAYSDNQAWQTFEFVAQKVGATSLNLSLTNADGTTAGANFSLMVQVVSA